MKVIVCKGCGQVMQATNAKTGKPSCITCFGISPDSSIPIEVDAPMESAVCAYCKTPLDSTEWKNVKPPPFYDSKHNTFYCGCRGWD